MDDGDDEPEILRYSTMEMRRLKAIEGENAGRGSRGAEFGLEAIRLDSRGAGRWPRIAH